MKNKVLYGLISTSLFLHANTVVSDDSKYFKLDSKKLNTQIIFPLESKTQAQQALEKEQIIHETYSALYGWNLDEKLYVGLISSNNQIANGFSSQYPNNRQINYMGGTLLLDEFSSISWLDTLLYHESAHNYQTNIKNNRFSQFLHSYLGNGSFMTALPFITPNITESSFLLEGDAVLHESLFGNGGRLYNGLYKAQTILQAKAGHLTPTNLYNETISFPYGDKFYGIGGFFQLYLAQKYGIKRVDSYFRYHSNTWWFPFFTNTPMKDAIGVNFEEAVRDFSYKYKQLAKDFMMLNGENTGLESQFLYPLNSDEDEIYFMINKDAKSQPQLVIIDKKSSSVQKYKVGLLASKVIKEKGNYYTQASSYISPTRIIQGLYDEDGNLKEDSNSKMVQGYLSDGKTVYFDVKSSFNQPQLYVGKKFYAQVNSSVFIDKDDNLYYFKQDGVKRTLYKNKTALLSYDGYYGIVSDVDTQGNIYFVANSKLGSTLFRYKDGAFQRVTQADNIAYAKLLSNDKIFFCALGEESYYYNIQKIAISQKEKPYFKNLFSVHSIKPSLENEKIKPYSSLQDMHYSGTNLELYMGSNGLAGTIQLNFVDPLEQNALSTYIKRDEDNALRAGAIYMNSLYSYNYNLSFYSVLDKGDSTTSRDFGISADILKELYRKGKDSVALELSYLQDYYEQERDPLLLTLDFTTYEKYGYSFYNNYLNTFSLLAQQEEEDSSLGFLYSFEHDIYDESYIGLYSGALFMLENIDTTTAQNDARGIKLTQYQDMDRASFYLPNLLQDYYVNNISYAKISFKKVFNLSSYWFTFPLSLQRESLYVDYTYYRLNAFQEQQKKESIDLYTVGTTLATLFFNKLELPISIEYNHIENSSDIFEQKDSVMMKLEAEF
jgi:hypothetical protein